MFSCCSGKTVSDAPLKFTYFPLFAKGPAVALALEMSGLKWEGAFPEDWKTMKAKTPFGALPTLEVPGFGLMAQEAAILNFVGREAPAMAGSTKKDFAISQQLLCEGEDIYRALQTKQDTIVAKNKVSQEVNDVFWGPADPTVPNGAFSINMFLTILEEFYQKSGSGSGKFTTSGRTVGECKIWCIFQILSMIKGDVLDKYPGLAEFQTRMNNEKETKELLTTGAQMPKPFPQGYIAKESTQATEGGA